jgi:hypothetical protein
MDNDTDIRKDIPNVDADRVLSTARALSAISPADGVEYLVEGSAVGESGMIPCVLDSEGDGVVSITLADGPNTGFSTTVDKSKVTALGKEFYEDASKRLFR